MKLMSPEAWKALPINIIQHRLVTGEYNSLLELTVLKLLLEQYKTTNPQFETTWFIYVDEYIN